MDEHYAKQASFSEIIKHKGFINLWLNQVLVQLTYNSLNFALLVWVFRLTDSSTAVSTLLFAVYLPAVLLNYIPGMLVDMVDRRRIIRWANLFMAVSFILLFVFKDSYPSILFLAFLVNVFAQFYIPAEASAIPLIVSRRELMAANSLFSMTLFSTFLLGFGLTGPIMNHLGIELVFILGSLILFIAFLLTFSFPKIVNPQTSQTERLKQAWRKKEFQVMKQLSIDEIKKSTELIRGKLAVFVSLLILAFVQVGIGILGALIPSFFEKTLHVNATDASYVLILPLGVGMVLGGFLIGKFGYRFPRRTIVGGAILTAGFLLFVVGLSPLISPAIKYFSTPTPLPFFYQIPLSSILATGSFILGMMMVSIVIPSQTVLQENTPEEVRGKVYALLGVLMSGLTIIPVLVVGVMADYFGTAPIFIAIGGSVALLGVIALRPSFYFKKEHLPYKLREFLGLGHWEEN